MDTDIAMMADPFDTLFGPQDLQRWLNENDRLVSKYGSLEDAEWDARRDEYEPECGD